MKSENITVQRANLTLRGVLNTPENATDYDLALIMHGFTGDKGKAHEDMLYELSEKLTAKGVATIRFDFDGHGESDGDFSEMTVPSEIADASVFLNYARHLPNVNQIYLLGHSQGGVVASMVAGLYHDEVTKLVLMAPAATLKEDALKGRLQSATYDPNHIPEKLPLGAPLDYLNLAVGGLYLRTAQVMPIYEVAQQFEGPVSLIHGSADVIVDNKASRKYDDVYANSELHIVDGAGHTFEGATREISTDLAVAFLTE
ncbi:alpha/beta hydrolase [Secundilactobacillus paracollinoides]|uniref:Alpha/beta hydrolase n=1 Tax=Secundilactobacillus paracollinoides TaxID=240427 RepID=A0A1B2J0N9_9LACO|nr:alpha/beta fold hydrolase [Secundilactobacillus paracollinoides]ANZ61958.1 alpha/beta hydrolase [Secundilactobacillus paracollinoides]ANZ67904.1 alpha/beta hydrolase [Secundilactobacillus paracollinoides]